MKRNGLILILALLLTVALAMPAAAAPKVLVDGSTLNFSVPPRVEQGTTLVPLRGIFEALGASVVWDGATQTVNASKGGTQIKLQIGSKTAYRNGQAVTLSVPGKVIGGSTLVPLRFVSEALGADVKWDGAAQTITIASSSLPLSVSPTPYKVKDGQFTTKYPMGWNIIEEVRNGSSGPIYVFVAETPGKTAQVIVVVTTVGLGYTIDQALSLYSPPSSMKNWQETSRTKIQTGCGPGWLVHGKADIGGNPAKAYNLLALDVDQLVVAHAWCHTSNWAAYEPGFREILASITPASSPVSDGPPSSISVDLTREFGSVGGLSGYSFTDIVTDSTIMVSVGMNDDKAMEKWRALPEPTRKEFLRDMLNRVRGWYPDRGVFISVSITYSYHTWDPSLNANIISFDPRYGWYVSNTYYGGRATYFWDGAITIDPNE